MTKKVHVKIPATSANMGSGFDAVGIALTLYNEILFEERPGAEAITIKSKEWVRMKSRQIPEKSGIGSHGIRGKAQWPAASCRSSDTDQPHSAGTRLRQQLGSSRWRYHGRRCSYGAETDKEDILIIANSMEGHPDNVAPATYGGLTSSIIVHDKAITNSVPVGNDLSFITVSPELKFLRKKRDRLCLIRLIIRVPYSMSAASVSSCLPSLRKRYEYLKYSLQDKLHVPYRIRLIPHGQDVLDAATAAGALGSTISGSGSTLIAFATEREKEIEEAMISTFAGYDIYSFGHILKADNQGATYVEISE